MPMGVGQALGVRGGGNSLDNTLRVAHLVPTEWVLLDIRVHAVERGFGHGLVHMFAEDGTLLATASQSCIVRYWKGEVPTNLAGGSTMTMSLPIRPGMTVPLPGPLHSHREKLNELADLGYTDIWSAEADGADAFTPLTLASAWEPRLRLGTAIVPAYTRSPACFAQSVASLADAAPGRFAIGIGSSSNVIVERWNGVPFVEPYKKVRDVVRFLRDALSGEKVAKSYDTFEVQGFRLGVRPEQMPPILVAALREGMLKLAAREGDGAIINWLSGDDVTQVAERGARRGRRRRRRRSCAGSSAARARTPTRSAPPAGSRSPRT